MAINFQGSPQPTLGIEEEYQLCDPDSGDLVPRVERIMDRASPELRERLSYDLLLTLVEANTVIAESVEEGIADLHSKRQQVQALAETEECTLGLTGTHPFAEPQAQRFVGTPDYQWVAEQLGYVAQRNLTFGLHVHVGVDEGDRAIYVTNRMRQWIGPMIALAANSPYLDSVDTGWDSARVYAFGAFPRAGIPPRLEDWAQFEAQIERLLSAESITKPRQIWWNVRAHPEYGTVEVRAFDVQISLARTAALVALTQALVVAYSDAHRRGEPEPPLAGAFLEDSRWKGMRFGLDAMVVDPCEGDVLPMTEYVGRMLEVARPAASRLGTTDYLDAICEILTEGNGATQQRALAAECDGDLRALQLLLLRRARELGIDGPKP
ncbi:MAG: YbdK family carboxylate-amine ligase [Acidobacteriota bacterium]